MAADIPLEPYVQSVTNKVGKTYFYFRVVQNGRTHRVPLPHPFEPEYRKAYDTAHAGVFGTTPGEFESPTGIRRLTRDHRNSRKYQRLSKTSRSLRDLALDLMNDRWGPFNACDIQPIHVQTLYDSLSDRPATANRRLDDISAVFGWGRPRGFVNTNPCSGIERIENDGSYEPWPEEALNRLIELGKPQIVRVALVAAYTGQRRGDILTKLCDANIKGSVWYLRQGKTKKLTTDVVPVPLHPVVMAIIEDERARRRMAGVLAPKRPLLLNSRGQPWTASGFGASWRTELIRLDLKPERKELLDENDTQLVFHGLRHTAATIIATTVARKPEMFGGIARVKSMLGHLTERMSKHYARHAEVEHLNNETMLLLPDIGNTPDWIGNSTGDEDL